MLQIQVQCLDTLPPSMVACDDTRQTDGSRWCRLFGYQSGQD